MVDDTQGQAHQRIVGRRMYQLANPEPDIVALQPRIRHILKELVLGHGGYDLASHCDILIARMWQAPDLRDQRRVLEMGRLIVVLPGRLEAEVEQPLNQRDEQDDRREQRLAKQPRQRARDWLRRANGVGVRNCLSVLHDFMRSYVSMLHRHATQS